MLPPSLCGSREWPSAEGHQIIGFLPWIYAQYSPWRLGWATLSVKYNSTKDDPEKRQKATLQLKVENLEAGDYSITATIADGTPSGASVSLGTFNSEAGGSGPEDYDLDASIPPSIDALHITELTITSADGVAVLRGDGDATQETYSVSALVTGADGRRRGTVRLYSKFNDESDEDDTRKVSFSGSGAPARASLNIMVTTAFEGTIETQLAGTVVSDAKGKVKFDEADFDEDVDFPDTRQITITDAAGSVLMSASF